MEAALSYLWVIPLAWMTVDRNRMANKLQSIENQIIKEVARNNGLHTDVKEQKRMLEKIVTATNEIQTSIAYWKGKTEQT